MILNINLYQSHLVTFPIIAMQIFSIDNQLMLIIHAGKPCIIQQRSKVQQENSDHTSFLSIQHILVAQSIDMQCR